MGFIVLLVHAGERRLWSATYHPNAAGLITCTVQLLLGEKGETPRMKIPFHNLTLNNFQLV